MRCTSNLLLLPLMVLLVALNTFMGSVTFQYQLYILCAICNKSFQTCRLLPLHLTSTLLNLLLFCHCHCWQLLWGRVSVLRFFYFVARLCNRAFAVERHIQRETIIRIRIRSTIIRIRITDTRILRIIRISSRKQLVHPKHRNLLLRVGWSFERGSTF